ncbi:MAG TPA: hypothetical protein VIX11_00165 [Candidatus Acidoferrum sp.]
MTHFTGEVEIGQEFEKSFAPNMVFKLEAFGGGALSGWLIRVVPGSDPHSNWINCIGTVNDHIHGGAPGLSILAADKESADQAVSGSMRKFDFVPDAADCRAIWNPTDSMSFPTVLSYEEREEASKKLPQTLVGHGRFVIVDSRLGPPRRSGDKAAVEWLKFEVYLDVGSTADSAAVPPLLTASRIPPRDPLPDIRDVKFSGEVQSGQQFERAVAPGMVFRLAPYAGNVSGWSIRLAPSSEPLPASIDCIGAISVPLHGNMETELELPDGGAISQVELRRKRELMFVPTPSDCKAAWDLTNLLNYTYNLSDIEREKADRKLGELPTAIGAFKVIDFIIGDNPAKRTVSGIAWLKFDAELDFQRIQALRVSESTRRQKPE